METLIEEEIEIYNKLPFKIRELLSSDLNTLMWVKSKYNMGYDLKIPNHLYDSTPNEYSNWLISNKQYNTFSMGSNIPSNYSDILKEHAISKDKLSWGIPYSPDSIIDTLESIVINFYSSINDSEFKNTYKQNKEEFFNFEVYKNEKFNCILKIKADDVKIYASSNISFRHMSLKLALEVWRHIEKNHKPSITNLKNLRNITKENGEKQIIFDNPYGYQSVIGRFPYSLFAEDDIVSFIEGDFIIKNDSTSYNELVLNEIINYQSPSKMGPCLTTQKYRTNTNNYTIDHTAPFTTTTSSDIYKKIQYLTDIDDETI